MECVSGQLSDTWWKKCETEHSLVERAHKYYCFVHNLYFYFYVKVQMPASLSGDNLIGRHLSLGSTPGLYSQQILDILHLKSISLSLPAVLACICACTCCTCCTKYVPLVIFISPKSPGALSECIQDGETLSRQSPRDTSTHSSLLLFPIRSSSSAWC